MSQKIDDVLEVLTRIRRAYQRGRPNSLRDARTSAIKAIAAERGVTYQTIGDAYLRRLKPDVDGTPQFDMLVREWLSGKPGALRGVLDRHALDADDERAISQFFA
jgi:hypothetical protein